MSDVAIRLISHSTIEAAVEAARVCYSSMHKSDSVIVDGVYTIGANDKKLIQSCIKRDHTSVIEHVSYTFKISGVSRAFTHQLVRHRIASYSQQSQRYVKQTEPEYVTPPSVIDKMGPEYFSTRMGLIWQWYNEMVESGVKAEDARYILPNACESSMVYTFNARSLRNLFGLRLDRSAQWEIREACELMHQQLPESHKFMFGDLTRSA